MIDRLKYRTQRHHNEGEISDVFDGMAYKRLTETTVTIDNAPLPHKYFSDRRDLAFGASTDGFQVCAL
jgi:hypothetical protein